MEQAVAILPYGRKLGRRPGKLSTAGLDWPLGIPARLAGKSLADLSPDDHLIIFPQLGGYVRPHFGTRAKVSIMLVEPEVVHGHHVKWLKLFWWRFFRVLCAVEHLVDAVPNSVLFPFGSTWVPDWREVDTAKDQLISCIVSKKRHLPGHRLRHEIADWAIAQNISVDVIGHAYRPFDKKKDGLAPYRFSVVIENSVQPNYFTEKLIDAVLCETVPIYWGCPNIDRFLDTRGMIICKDKDDIRRAVLAASEKLYQGKLPHLLAVKERAARFGEFQKRAAEAVRAA